MSDARREAIEKAWSEAEDDTTEEVVENKSEQVEVEPVKELAESEPEAPKEEPVKDKTLEVEKKAATDREKPPVKEAAKDPAATDRPVTDRPPASWKPAQREQWGQLPEGVRSEIVRREREIQEGMKQTESIRRFANEFAQIVQPYNHLIAAAGSTPLRAVDSMMRTAAVLTTGSQEQKAQTLVNLIAQYGVDIPTLDKVLSGVVKDGRVQGAPQQQQEQPPAWARPMFEFMQTVQQSRQQAEQRVAQEAQAAVESMTDKPFFEDLREEMADLIEVAARRGRTMGLEEAYERAVAANPEIRGILEQRKAASNARSPVSEAAATLARARRAASTVASGPAGEGVGSRVKPKSRLEAIEAAWEAASG